MSEQVRKIETHAFRIVILILSISVLFGAAVTWLFKTNKGRSLVFKSILSIVDSNSPFDLAYERLESTDNGIQIVDLHLDLANETRLLSVDTVKTATFFSSILNNSIEIPELKLLGVRFEQVLSDTLIKALPDVQDNLTQNRWNSWITEYLKSFSISFNDVKIDINEFQVEHQNNRAQIDQFILDLEYLQFSNQSIYSVINQFSVDAIFNNKTYDFALNGIIYSDTRDLDLREVNLSLNGSKLNFELEFRDVFSYQGVNFSNAQNQKIQLPRSINLDIAQESIFNLAEFFPEQTLVNKYRFLNAGLSAKMLPRVGIIEIDDIKLESEFSNLNASVKINNAFKDNQLNNFSEFSADTYLEGSLNRALLTDLSRSLSKDSLQFYDDLSFKLNLDYNAGFIDQVANFLIGADSLEFTHQYKPSFADTQEAIHSIELKTNSLSLAKYSSLNEIPHVEGVSIALNTSGSLPTDVESIQQLDIEVSELPEYDLSNVVINFKSGTGNKSLRTQFNFHEALINTVGEVDLSSEDFELRNRVEFQKLIPAKLLKNPIWSDDAISGILDTYLSIDLLNDKFDWPNLSHYVEQVTSNLVLESVVKDTLVIPSHQLGLSYLRSSNDIQIAFEAPFATLSSKWDIAESNSKNLTRTLSYLLRSFKQTYLNDSLSILAADYADSIKTIENFKSVTRLSLKNPIYLRPWLKTGIPTKWDGMASFDAQLVDDLFTLNSIIESKQLEFEQFNWSDSRTELSYQARVTNNETLLDNDFEFTFGMERLNVGSLPIRGISSRLNLKDFDFNFALRTDEFVQNARFDFDLEGRLKKNEIAVNLPNFDFGNEIYGWRNATIASLTQKQQGTWALSNFRLINGAESIEIFGEIGPKVDNLLNYRLNNLDLAQLSDLVEGRVPLAGLLNGTFALGKNSDNPFFDGELTVDSLSLRDRTLGDFSLQSFFDATSNRYQASLALFTPIEKYPDIPFQNIYGSGFFNPKQNALAEDTLAYIDLEFEDVDLWFLPSIAINVFDSTSGRATGYGNFIATGETYNYDTWLSVDSVYTKPVFLNTDFFMSGPIYFTRNEGVVVDTLIVDDQYGNAKFWGVIDLNDFQEEKFLDLTMQLNGLQFMNNVYDPDVPFYGNVRGSGLVTLRGSTFNPTISTDDAIRISEGSELKLPLLSETDFEGQKSYIRFTDSFDKLGKTTQDLLQDARKKERSPGSIFSRNLNDEERNFVDFFNLELLFSAPEQTTIELIFDDVTNETMRANGSGDLRVGLSDGVVRINGAYNLTNGRYNFVSGDFFTRVFTLEPGGQIIWDGDPTNAQINVSASYTQRADFTPFFGQATDQQNTTVFRVPVNMVLDLTGRLQSIENDYRFSLPSNMDLSANADLINNIITSINSEQYKLYQATSFLLTNSFLPMEGGVGGLADANRSVIDNIQQNPDALIAPLLSNQINSLLNTNLGTIFQNLEFDINLSTLDQIDLGLALRLFKDRLVIRRNRSIANNQNQNTLGDIDANYKLSDRWSLLVFHRQDPLFSDIGGGTNQQTANTQALNGVGIEWQQQFASWKTLWRSIGKIWSNLFGRSNNAESDESNSANENAQLTFTPLVKTPSNEQEEINE